MFVINDGDVFIFANGNIRKVLRFNVKLYDKGVEIERGKKGKNETKVHKDLVRVTIVVINAQRVEMLIYTRKQNIRNNEFIVFF